MRRNLARLLVAVTLIVPALPLATAPAQAGNATQVTAMTRNLYLGADLGPAISAPDAPAFLAAVAGIYANVLATDFPTRAGALAGEVAATHPDLIGLEEVSRWTVSGPSPAPSLDFLDILQANLAARGLHYDVAAVSDNASIGPVPLVGPLCDSLVVGACLLQFQDRDVILVNHDRAGLTTSGARHGRYATQLVVNTPVGPLSFDRGWATVEVGLTSHHFRFALTHLETEAAPAVQEAEAVEFRAAVKAPGNVLAVGDFNSASDGSQTASYAFLTSDYFRDAAAGVGPTCCQTGTLADPVSHLATRIDLVLTHGSLLPAGAVKVGAAPFEAKAPYWASDHAGVVATLRLP
jgi:hypothetical protein